MLDEHCALCKAEAEQRGGSLASDYVLETIPCDTFGLMNNNQTNALNGGKYMIRHEDSLEYEIKKGMEGGARRFPRRRINIKKGMMGGNPSGAALGTYTITSDYLTSLSPACTTVPYDVLGSWGVNKATIPLGLPEARAQYDFSHVPASTQTVLAQDLSPMYGMRSFATVPEGQFVDARPPFAL